MELLHTLCSPKVHIDFFKFFTTALLFTFERPMYMFFEEDITGTVCVNKTGDTTETVQIIIQGGKLTTDREAVIARSLNALMILWCLVFFITPITLACGWWLSFCLLMANSNV